MLRQLNWFATIPMFIAFSVGCGDQGNVDKSASGKTNSQREPIVLLAAASTADAVEELTARFEEQTGMRVRVSTGPSNALATQIVSGAPADLFLSANEKWAEHVAQEGLSAAVAPLLTNDLVLVVPQKNAANVHSAADLAGSHVKRIALAGENVPAGMYAEQALRAIQLYEPLLEAKKIVRGQDVRVTLSYVARGEADAGIVYSTDAKVEPGVAVVAEFDPQTYDRVVYPLVLVKRDRSNFVARKLYDFLRSPEAAAVFEEFGFRMKSP